MINQGGRQCCRLSHTLSVFVVADSSEWQIQQKSHFSLWKMISDTLLFADDQVIFSKSEDELQMATLHLSNTMTACDLDLSYNKMNMVFCGKYQIRSKVMLNNKTIEQIQNFNYLGYDISFSYDNDLRQHIQISICHWHNKENIKKQN
jgi:hypothetical protein